MYSHIFIFGFDFFPISVKVVCKRPFLGKYERRIRDFVRGKGVMKSVVGLKFGSEDYPLFLGLKRLWGISFCPWSRSSKLTSSDHRTHNIPHFLLSIRTLTTRLLDVTSSFSLLGENHVWGNCRFGKERWCEFCNFCWENWVVYIFHVAIFFVMSNKTRCGYIFLAWHFMNDGFRVEFWTNISQYYIIIAGRLNFISHSWLVSRLLTHVL